MNGILDALREAFGNALRCDEQRGQQVVHVAVEAIDGVVRLLKEKGFRLLLDVTAVDRLPRTPRFDVVYHLYHLDLRDWIRLQLETGEEGPEVPSVAGIFPAANWAEREVFDLFGIVFRGHPDLRRILMPEDWQGHPLRKDYPLAGWRPLPALARD